MPVCVSKYFGEVEYGDDSVIRFPRGPAGFESEESFLILNYPDQYPLVFIQSLSTPELCFAALPVFTIEPVYRLRTAACDATLLGISDQPAIGEEVLCLALVTAHEENPTANLLAPIVVNLHSRRGLQCMHADGCYSHQHPLLTAQKAAAV